MIERDKEYYNQKISELYAVIENQEKIIGDLQTEIFGLNDRLSCAKEQLDLYKSVIDEVREYIKNKIQKINREIDFEIDMGSQGNYHKQKAFENFIKILEDLLKILDKAKGSDK